MLVGSLPLKFIVTSWSGMFCAYLEWARDEMLAVSNCDSNDGTNGTRFLGLCMLPAGSAGGGNLFGVRALIMKPYTMQLNGQRLLQPDASVKILIS